MSRISSGASRRNEGWWGVESNASAFAWRDLGWNELFRFCQQLDDGMKLTGFDVWLGLCRLMSRSTWSLEIEIFEEGGGGQTNQIL